MKLLIDWYKGLPRVVRFFLYLAALPFLAIFYTVAIILALLVLVMSAPVMALLETWEDFK